MEKSKTSAKTAKTGAAVPAKKSVPATGNVITLRAIVAEIAGERAWEQLDGGFPIRQAMRKAIGEENSPFRDHTKNAPWVFVPGSAAYNRAVAIVTKCAQRAKLVA